MKRFLSIFLSAAMLLSATPTAFAQGYVRNESVIATEELTSGNQDESTGNISEGIFGERVEKAEEINIPSSEEQDGNWLATIENTVDKSVASIRVDGINNDWNDYYFSNLNDAVKAINEHPSNGNTARIFILTDNMDLAQTLNIGSDSSNVSVQIYASVETVIKRADGFKGAFFSVAKGSTLTFGNKSQSSSYKNLTLDGNKANVTANAPLIVSEGTLVFNRDITLQNNLNSYGSIMGAAIYVSEDGSFTMNDGLIEGNSTTYLFGDCGGGVYAKGDVTINGGTIQKNTQITTYTGYEGETGNSLYIYSSKTLKITGGTLKSNFAPDDQDIILRSYSMTYGDDGTFEYSNCKLELSGSPVIDTIIMEIDKRNVTLKSDNSNVTLTVKPNIEVVGALSIDSPITILGGWYFDWTVDPEVTYADIPINTQIITFSDGVEANNYVSLFKYSGEETRYFNVDSEGGLSLSDAPAGYAVIVTPPTFKYGDTDRNIATINISGADSLDCVSEGTELTLSVENVFPGYSLVRYVVTNTQTDEEITVAENKFKMPGAPVNVTAEFNFNIPVDCTLRDSSNYFAFTFDDATNTAQYSIKYNGKIIGAVELTAPTLAAEYSQWSGELNRINVATGNQLNLSITLTDSTYICKSVTATTNIEDCNVTNNGDGHFIVDVPTGGAEKYGNVGYVNLYLNIAPVNFNITTNITHGTISGITSPAVIGSTVNFTLAPEDETYELESYQVYKTSDDSVTVEVSENNGTYSFTMPAYPVTVSAVFVKKTHAVTIEIQGETAGGSVSIDKTSPVTVGEEVKVTVETNANYVLNSLTMNGKEITDNTFIMPNETAKIVAAFAKQQFTVTASSTTNGTITLLTSSPLNWGDNFAINVKADPHYEIDTVTVDGVAVTVDAQGDYTFTMPTHDVTVNATFKKKAYAINITGEHFTIVENPGQSVWGETVTIKLNAEQWYNYNIFTVTPNTVLTGGNGTWTFTMPQSDITIDIQMERPNFNVEFISNGGSSVNGQVIANGNTVAKPSTPTYVNHGFAGWYTSPTFEAGTKYDFSTNVTGDLKLYARWFLWGDVNGDGKVTPFDAVQLDRCYVGSMKVENLAVPMAARVTDSNKTKPTPFDSVQIKRKYVGSLDRFPAENTSYEYDLENNTVITE